MFAYMRICLMIFCLLLPAGLSSVAYAQGIFGPNKEDKDEDEGGGLFDNEDEEDKKVIDQYDPKYRPEIKSDERGMPSLLPTNGYAMYFVRAPNAGAREVTLRFTEPAALSGCVSIDTPKPEITRNGQYMQIKIGKPVVRLDKTVRYAHYECKGGPSFVESDITLNADELMKKKIQYITFKNESAADKYTVDVSNTRFMLVPQSTSFFKPFDLPGRIDPLSYWFYPENTVILSAPGASAQQDVTAEIRKMAQSKGLVELKTLIKNFKPPVTDKNTLYFVDQSGNFAKSLDAEQGRVFGTVQTSETFHGKAGAFDRLVNLDIHAKLPGLLD